MNIKRFLIIAVSAVLSVSLLALVITTKSTPVKAKVQADVSISSFVNEPAVRMQSGPIQYSDNNAPDFKLRAVIPSKLDTDTGCISDENARPRRYGGCVE